MTIKAVRISWILSECRRNRRRMWFLFLLRCWLSSILSILSPLSPVSTSSSLPFGSAPILLEHPWRDCRPPHYSKVTFAALCTSLYSTERSPTFAVSSSSPWNTACPFCRGHTSSGLSWPRSGYSLFELAGIWTAALGSCLDRRTTTHSSFFSNQFAPCCLLDFDRFLAGRGVLSLCWILGRFCHPGNCYDFRSCQSSAGAPICANQSNPNSTSLSWS